MNFDDYEYHIIQKYRLAVAISVLKTKPEETSLEQHITNLRNKFNDKMDMDITICSDDFNLDDDTDFDVTNHLINDFTENNDDLNNYNDMQLLKLNESQNNTLLKDNCDKVSNHFGNKLNCVKENEFSDVIYLFKDIGQNPECDMPQYNTILTRSTYCESLQPNFDPTIMLESLADNAKPNRESIIHTEDEYSCDDFYKFNSERPSVCQSAVNKEVSNVIDRTDQNISHNNTNMRLNDRHLNQHNELRNPEFNLDNNLTYYDSQATEIYTLHGFTQNYTHVSQSQNCDFDISKKFITGKSKTLNKNIDVKVSHKTSQNCNNNTTETLIREDNSKNLVGKDNNDNVIEDLAINVINKDSTLNITQDKTRNNNLDTQTVRSDNLNTDNVENLTLERGFIQDFSENAQRYFYSDDYPNINEASVATNIEKNTDLDNNFNESSNKNDQDIFSLEHTNDLNVKDTKIDQETNILQPQEIDEPIEDISEEESTLQIELVPFKVIEELNKLRTFLNRRERKMSYDGSSDSGYKSDSQGRSHRNSLQLSGAWLNQTAHCLFDYITRCPLVSSAQEITGDISQVLGELIDKLHEEEIYPLFLEELLEYHNSLIQEIFTSTDTLLEKDESIQRFLLLNKSTHILKYSIEKLTETLDYIYIKLIDEENFYELTNIVEIENTSYIFHVLEIIIKRYLKLKNIIENTQISQTNDNIIKKSSISDIWRKKWNPNYRDDVKINVGVEKKCVFTKCSEVLNKIVVGCMSGYSLVSFAALQCFNLLQS